MRRHRRGILLVAVAGVMTLGILLTGCGDKIAIPQPTGVFSINQYKVDDIYEVEGQAIQLTQGLSTLFILTPGTLSKRDTNFGLSKEVTGLAGPLSLCIDEGLRIIFVWEDDAKRVRWYDSSTLDILGENILLDVETAVGMATNPSGIDQVPGGTTFLYLSDPITDVIHRYSFSMAEGLSPFGILARSDGLGVRFVHEAAGLATDGEDFLLVCDVDVERNWLTRFASSPDPIDADLRGYAALYDSASCDPPAATDYVIGHSAECNESDWVGGPSDALGEFTRPSDVAVDRLGRIYVADTDNKRIQLFSAKGAFDIQFLCTDSDTLVGPTSLGIFDENNPRETGVINYGAYIFVTLQDRATVIKFISFDHYQALNGELPPPD